MNIIVIAIIIIVTVYIVSKMMSKKANTHQKSKNQTQSQPKPQKVNKTEKLINDLLKINIKIRTEDLPNMKIAEQIIDELQEIIPQMIKNYPDKEITWQTEKIASDYFPKLINSFCELTKDQQSNQKGSLQQSLEALKLELTKIQNLINSANQADFDLQANEISVRFSNILG